MKVKFFWKSNPVVIGLQNARALEDEINAWLSEHPSITVIDIKQTSGGGSYFGGLWFISVWYEERAATSTD